MLEPFTLLILVVVVIIWTMIMTNEIRQSQKRHDEGLLFYRNLYLESQRRCQKILDDQQQLDLKELRRIADTEPARKGLELDS